MGVDTGDGEDGDKAALTGKVSSADLPDPGPLSSKPESFLVLFYLQC